ncbi:MAG: hypothetical protein RLY49_392 [Candidatus Parcubacteria bacterium]
MAKGSLTVRRTSQADTKVEHSEPRVTIRWCSRLSDKSYSGDNRLVLPKSPNRRQCSAPRCRLILSWGWRRSQGFGCSPIKKVRELGSDRLESKHSLDFEQSEPVTSRRDKQIHGGYNKQLLYGKLTYIGGTLALSCGQYRGKS